jgi:RNA polymerase sigma-70 factor (ECF subfamily)
LLALAIHRLRDEHQARGKLHLFQALAPFLDGADPGDYEKIAGELGMASGTVAVTVHRLRSRLQELIRAEVAQTVDSPKQVAEELRHLMAVWGR